MDILAKNKVMAWSIGILILLNLTCLSMLWFRDIHRHDQMPPAPMDHERAARFLKNQLDLSDSQFNEYLRLRDDHFSKTQAIEQKMKSLRQDLIAELFKNPPDQEAASEFMSSIGSAQASLESLTFNHFLDLKKLCGPEQADILHKMVHNLFRRPANASPQAQPGNLPPGNPPPGNPPPGNPPH
jgi:periplasmic protein CpxP/Spy